MATKSGFSYYSTAEQVIRNIDMYGKNVIITGANSGIGYESARVLSQHGAHIIMACRDEKKAQEAAIALRNDGAKQNKNVSLEIMILNLSSLNSVQRFAEEFNSSNRPLHVLMNNAGVMATPYQHTEDGFEYQFGTNHLGHFLLSILLLPSLKRAAPSRVICVSSLGHRFSDVNWNDLQWEQKYLKWKAYGQSKTANILFAQEFNKRFSKDGVYANSLHPGRVAATNLGKHLAGNLPMGLLIRFFEFVGYLKNIPQGAATQVYMASAPELERVGGHYFDDSNISVPLTDYASDPKNAERLWEISEKLVGL